MGRGVPGLIRQMPVGGGVARNRGLIKPWTHHVTSKNPKQWPGARGQYRHGPNVGSWLLPIRIPRGDGAASLLLQMTDDEYFGSAIGLCY